MRRLPVYKEAGFVNPWAIGLLAFIGLFVLLSVVLAFVLLFVTCGRLKKRPPARPEDDVFYSYRETMDAARAWYDAQRAEELWIRSYDGLRLYGRLLVREEARGTILMMHGYHGEALRDFAASMRCCYEEGYNLLLPDERTHGRSEGRYITFGVRERCDVLSWLAAVNERFGADRPVFLHGVSMGCSAVLMAAGLKLPDNVRGLVADCGYTRPWDICAHVMRNRMHLPVFPILHIIGVLSWLIAGFGLVQASCPRALKRNALPVLFYHGGKDDLVPIWMGNANYTACRAEKKQIIAVEAAHAQSFLVEPERCCKELIAFLERYGGSEFECLVHV